MNIWEQGVDVLKDVANTQANEVTIIGLEAVIILIIGGLWYRREMNWEKKMDKAMRESSARIAALQDEIKAEVRSHSEELKRAHESAIDLGQRALTMIELKQRR